MTDFGVVLGKYLLCLVVWCAATTWVAVSIWSASPKPASINVSDQAKNGHSEKEKTQ